MRRHYLSFLFIIFLLLCGNVLFAQMVGTQLYLPGHWLEIGQNNYGAFGANPPPAAYHPYPAGTDLAETYDYGHDGWTVGAPPLMGDYTYPGSPFEGWGIQVNGAAGNNYAFTSSGGITGPGSLTGANVSYVNAGGQLLGNWAGTTAGGQLKINMQTRVDTNASWVVVTAKLYNTGATTLNNIYYFRSCDPDNDEAHGGSFATDNVVTFQNDIDHRVGVSAHGETYTYAYLQLCTKDCRAKALVYESWPLYTADLSTVYTGTAAIYPDYTVGTADNGDIAIGLVYQLGNLCAGDSAFVSYAYTFLNTANGIDSAFPEPTIVVNGVPVIPPAAPGAIHDTFNTCGTGLTTIPVDLTGAATGVWTWSTWTWTTGTGLATTTGLVNTINVSALPPIITYTITGTGYNSGCDGATSSTCGTRTIYLTIIACNGATVNSPCLGDALDFNAPGDSTGATYAWVGPNTFTTTVATTQSFTIIPSVWADTGVYHVIKTVGGVSDTALVHVVINPIPIISGPTSVCEGSTITLTSTVPVTSWTSSSGTIATVGATTGVVTGVTAGTVTITGMTSASCTATYIVTVNPVAPITGTASLCMGTTTLLSNIVPGGTWLSTNTGVATINSGGLVSGISAGTTTVSYTTPGTCVSTIIVTVYPVAAITGATLLCAGGTTTLNNTVAGGTWFSSNTAAATIAATGIVTGVAPGTSNITYTTPHGCISTTMVTVVILTDITGTEILCQGTTTTLADGSGGGVWTSTNTGVATIGAATGVVIGVAGGTANITYTGGAGCYTTAVVTVNPTSPIFGVLGMCYGFTTTLADGLTGGTWSSSNTAIATVNGSTGVVTGTAINGGTAIISYTLPTGCLMTVPVTVYGKPLPPATAPDTTCQYFGVTLTYTVTPGDTMHWYGAGVIPEGTIFTPNPYVDTAGVTVFYVTQASVYGCVSDSAALQVIVKPQPAPPITRDSIYCFGSWRAPFDYQVDSATGSYLRWYAAATGGAPITMPPPPTAVNYPNPVPWYVSQVVNGCESYRSTIMDTIVPEPSFYISASNTWVCDHDTLTFWFTNLTPGIPLIGVTYLWTLPPGATIVSGSASGTSISVRFDTVYGTHIIKLKVGELNYMCVTDTDLQITVIPLPTATGFMKPNICVGDTVGLALSYQSPSASVFSWFIDGIPLGVSTEINIVAANSNSGGPFSLSWNDSGMHYITVNCATEQGCKSLPTYDTVDVHALPDATFTFKPKSPGSLCLEDSVQFFANYVNYNCAYLWQPVTFFSNTNKPQAWGKLESAQSDIVLTITDPFGCAGSASQQIDPSSCCTVLFPNAFTPNGDQKNDVFRPLFNGYHHFHSFIIVNRWGQIVFESSDSNPAWDGTFNGVPQDIGTYFYYLKYDCGGNTIETKGDVTLIR